MQDRSTQATSLQGRAEKAKSQATDRCRNRSGRLHGELLQGCWRDIRKAAAYGVDEVAPGLRAGLGREHPPPGGATAAEELPGQTGQAALVRKGRHAETVRDTGRRRQAAAVGGHAPPLRHRRAGRRAVVMGIGHLGAPETREIH